VDLGEEKVCKNIIMDLGEEKVCKNIIINKKRKKEEALP